MAGGSLLDHALKLYAQDGVAASCVEWQDQYGVDVTVLLMAVWSGAGGYRLSEEDIAEAAAVIEPWRAEVVLPLRTLRRRLKDRIGAAPAGGSEKLRGMVKAAELEAEFAALRILEAHCPAGRPDADVALRENIIAVFGHFSEDAPEPFDDVARLCAAAMEITGGRS